LYICKDKPEHNKPEELYNHADNAVQITIQRKQHFGAALGSRSFTV